MIKLRNIPNKLQYDFIHISKLFFNDVQLIDESNNEGYIVDIIQNDDEARVSLFFDGKIIEEKISNLEKNSIKLALYDLLSKIRNSKSEYGILVGVRPVKVVHKLMTQYKDLKEIKTKIG